MHEDLRAIGRTRKQTQSDKVRHSQVHCKLTESHGGVLEREYTGEKDVEVDTLIKTKGVGLAGHRQKADRQA